MRTLSHVYPSACAQEGSNTYKVVFFKYNTLLALVVGSERKLVSLAYVFNSPDVFEFVELFI